MTAWRDALHNLAAPGTHLYWRRAKAPPPNHNVGAVPRVMGVDWTESRHIRRSKSEFLHFVPIRVCGPMRDFDVRFFPRTGPPTPPQIAVVHASTTTR
jgi:hypothetical protein